MPEALIIDAARTPRGIGKAGKGALAEFHPQQLAATVLKAIAERNNLNTADVDDVIWGTSSQRGKQGGEPAHHPTEPSRLTSSSVLASTANSIGSSRNTDLQKPSTIIDTASSSPMPRDRQ